MDYSKLKVAELKKIAEEKGIRNLKGAKKSELVELLTNIEMMQQGKAEEVQAADVSDPEDRVDAKENAGKSSKSVKKAVTKKVAPKKALEKESVKNAPEKESVKNASDKESVKQTPEKEMVKNAPNKEAVKKAPARKVAAKKAPVKKNSEKETPVSESETAVSEISEEKVTVSDISETKASPSNVSTVSEAKAVVSDISESAAFDENESAESEVSESEVQERENTFKPENEIAEGILELVEGYGFIRSDNYMPGDKDIYVSPAQIRKFRLRTGDIVRGPIRRKMNDKEKFSALLYIESVNGYAPDEILKRKKFEEMTPIFPNERIHLDYPGAPVSLRIVDIFSPIGKGQRGMIVSPPKAGKTTLLKQIARRISTANPEMNLLVLLIDERPEEVTDIKESIEGPNAEVIYSTFDELPEHHKRVSEMVIERAKRLVESGNDVVILIDSITRLSRAYNLTVPPSGRTLSGGLDPAALHMPKKFFGAARNMREGGSLTILATALIETGSRMDDVVFEEFKGTGNMELVLDRNLQEKRVFPAIDISKSGTRKDNLLLNEDEIEFNDIVHRRFHSLKPEDVTEDLLKLFAQTRDNEQLIAVAKKLFQKR